MAKKLKADDIVDVNDLSSTLAKAISGSFKKGSKEAFSGKSLVTDLKNQIDEYNKSQEQSIFNEKAKALAIRSGLDVREVELRLMVKQGQLEAKRAGDNTLFYQLQEQLETRQKQIQEQIKQEKHQQKELEIAERLKKYDEERLELFEKINTKAQLFKDFFGSKQAREALLYGVAIKYTVDTIKEGSEAFNDFRKEGLTVGQSFNELGKDLGAYFSLSGASLKENQEIMSGMASQLGSMEDISRDTVVEVGKMAKTFGVSAATAGQLQGQFQNMAGATAETATSTLEFTGNLAKAAHVAPGAVMADIAKNAEDTALYTRNGGNNIGVAAVAAKKLGVEFSSITKMADSLLDFENSINKQMQASALLGNQSR
jgi:hypothetical protein